MSWDDVIHEQERSTPRSKAQQGPGPIRRFLRWLLVGSCEDLVQPLRAELRGLRDELDNAARTRAMIWDALDREVRERMGTRHIVNRLFQDLDNERRTRKQQDGELWDYCGDLQCALERISQEVDASQLEDLLARLHVLESRLGRVFEEGDLGSEEKEFRSPLQVTPRPGVEPTNGEMGPQRPGGGGAKKSGNSESVAQIYSELRHLEARFHDLMNHVATNSSRLSDIEEQKGSEDLDSGGSAEVEQGIQRSLYELWNQLSRLEDVTRDQDRRIDAHEREIDGNNRMHEGIDQSTGEFRKRISELEERMYAREMEENRLAAQLSSMGGSGVIDELKARVSSLEGQARQQEEADTGSHAGLSSRISALERQLTSGPSALDGLLKRIRDVEQRMDRGEENNGAFRKEMQDTLEKIRYHAEALDPNAELDDVNTRIGQLEERVEQVVSDLESQSGGPPPAGGEQERRLEALEERIDTLETKWKESNGSLTNRIQHLEGVTRRHASQILEGDNDADRDRLNNVHRRLCELEDKWVYLSKTDVRDVVVSDLRKSHGELEKRIQSLGENQGSLESRIDALKLLQNDIRDAKQRAYAAESGIENLETRVSGMEQESTAQSDVEGRVGRLEEGQRELWDKMEHRYSRLREGQSHLKDDLDRLAGAVQSRSDFRERIEKLENSVDSLRLGLGERVSKLEGVRRGRDESVHQLQTTIIDHASRLEDLERSGRVEADKREKLAIRVSRLEQGGMTFGAPETGSDSVNTSSQEEDQGDESEGHMIAHARHDGEELSWQPIEDMPKNITQRVEVADRDLERSEITRRPIRREVLGFQPHYWRPAR